MWYLYLVMGLATLSVCAIVILAFRTKKTSKRLPATIVEKISYDNTIGQRYCWIVEFEDDGTIRRLYNTIYKSSKTEPKVGGEVTMIKVTVFNSVRYISILQYVTSFILPAIMTLSIIIFWYLLIRYF